VAIVEEKAVIVPKTKEDSWWDKDLQLEMFRYLREIIKRFDAWLSYA
jgi:hypothetical protein